MNDGKPSVEGLVGALSVLDGLSPFGKPTFAVEHGGAVRGLWFGTRRYELWFDREGGRELVKATEGHLGGVYADPTGTEDRLADGRFVWSAVVVDALVEAALAFDQRGGFFPTLADWAERAAIRRLRVTSPAELGRLPNAMGLAPFSSYLRGEPREWGSAAVPIGVDHADPSEWLNGPWFDQRSGQPITVSAGVDLSHLDGVDPDELAAVRHARAEARYHASHPRRRTCVRLRSIGEVATAWALLDDPTTVPIEKGDGSVWERGHRQPRPIRSAPSQVSLVGSEGRILVDRLANPLASPVDLQATYSQGEPWSIARNLLRTFGPAELARRSGLPDRTVRAVLNTERPPSPSTKLALTEAARVLADELLGDHGPDDPLARLGAAAVCLGGAGPRSCQYCGRSLSGRRSRWCSEACRKRGARAAARSGGSKGRPGRGHRTGRDGSCLASELVDLPACPRCRTIMAGRAAETHRCPKDQR